MYQLEKKDVEEIEWLLNQMPYNKTREIQMIKLIIKECQQKKEQN